MMNFLPYLGILVLILIAAFFSAAEMAYSSANRLRLKTRAQEGKLSARLAYDNFEHFDRGLTAILISNNLVNAASSALATVIAINLMGENGTWAATAIMTVLIVAFSEILPKVVASGVADDFARVCAVPVKCVTVLLTPLILLINFALERISRLWARNLDPGPAVTEDDLESIIETVEDEGVMDEDRCDLLQNALDFNDVLAYEIITPRVDMFAIDIDDEIGDTLSELMETPYSRIPVYEDTVDNIIGILHLNRVFKRLVAEDQFDNMLLRELLMPVWFVHKTMPLDDVLSVMKRHKSHLVIVTDEYGGTMGVLTMEDVLEQLVGEIWDESDEIEAEFKKVGRDLYEADGDMRIYDFFDELEIDDREFDDDNATLGGWSIEMLGGYPKVGQSFEYKNLTITVKKRRNLRVIQLAVQVHPELVEEEALL